MLANGHPNARDYPLGYMWTESRIVRQRKSAELKLAGVSIQLILGSLFSKESGTELQKLMKRLDDGI